MLTEARSGAALEGTAASDATRFTRVDAGADTFVAGNAVFCASDPKAEIGALRALCGVTV
jgi:pentose-5-phosphate-3-epimerase